MDLIIEFFIELFFELFGEGYIAIAKAFVPQKVVSEKGKKLISYVCLAVSLVLLIGLLVGIVILVETEGQNFFGWLFVVLNIAYLISGITMKIILHIWK